MLADARAVSPAFQFSRSRVTVAELAPTLPALSRAVWSPPKHDHIAPSQPIGTEWPARDPPIAPWNPLHARESGRPETPATRHPSLHGAKQSRAPERPPAARRASTPRSND